MIDFLLLLPTIHFRIAGFRAGLIGLIPAKLSSTLATAATITCASIIHDFTQQLLIVSINLSNTLVGKCQAGSSTVFESRQI
jgi:hypothetical protein